MKKRVLLPLFFSLSLSGCGASTNSQKGPMDRDLALLSLVRYRELQKAEGYNPPKTLKLRSTVQEITFHDNKLRDAKIEVQVDTEYVNGEKSQLFPYGHFLIIASQKQEAPTLTKVGSSLRRGHPETPSTSTKEAPILRTTSERNSFSRANAIGWIRPPIALTR